jgi:hypothetical protein
VLLSDVFGDEEGVGFVLVAVRREGLADDLERLGVDLRDDAFASFVVGEAGVADASGDADGGAAAQQAEVLYPGAQPGCDVVPGVITIF